MYIYPYEADYECPDGHRFVATAVLFKDDATARCPICYEQWIAANVPDGKQVSKSRRAKHDGSAMFA